VVDPVAIPAGTASARYANLAAIREPVLQRARDNAALTIPFLFTPSGFNQAEQVEVPWENFGAYAASTLGASIMLTLFPPGRPAMKLEMDEAAEQGLSQIEDSQERENMRVQLVAGLAQVEKKFTGVFEADGDRVTLGVGLLMMLVGGQHGVQFYPDGTIRGIGLHQHVTKRDPSGKLIEWGVKDCLSWETMEPDIQEACKERGYVEQPPGAQQTSIDVYTHGMLRAGRWTVYQEVYGFEVPESRRVYLPEFMPYQFYPWLMLPGEDYGRSYVELYLGDLQTMEGLTQTVTEGSAAVARFIQLVHPGGLTNRKAYAEADNGAVLSGRAEDVTTPESNKAADFRQAEERHDKVEARLGRAFLLNSSIQRQGERVTAEEIRFMASELEKALGAVYSQQLVTFQGPYLKLKLHYTQLSGRVLALPKGTTKVTVLGGLAALGRNAELDSLDLFIGGANQLFGPQAVATALGPNAIRTYMRRRAAALSIDTDGLIPTPDEAAQLDQQQQQQALISQLGPEALKQVGSGLTAATVANTNAQSAENVANIKAQSPAPTTPA
jgi:hypothetical protein